MSRAEMNIHRLEPAHSVIERLGGKAWLSAQIGLDRSSLTRWTMPRPQGTGGMIPQKHWPALINVGKIIQRPIKLKDLAGLGG